jgi:hypothetical protein
MPNLIQVLVYKQYLVILLKIKTMKKLMFMIITVLAITSCQNRNLPSKDDRASLPITLNLGKINFLGKKTVYERGNIKIKFSHQFDKATDQYENSISFYDEIKFDLSKLSNVKKITIFGSEDCDVNSTKLNVYNKSGSLMYSDFNKKAVYDYIFEINAGDNTIKYFTISACEGLLYKIIIE